MHCLLLFKLIESNHLFLNTPCRAPGGMCGGAHSLPFAEGCWQGHAWKCLQLEEFHLHSLSCGCAADLEQLLPAEHLGEGGGLWGGDLSKTEGWRQWRIKHGYLLLVWSPWAEVYGKFGCSC